VSILQKIVFMDSLNAALASAPRPLVFTNGVFDLLHPGHVTHLEEARALGRTLIVAINSDNSARALGKGFNRPINGSHFRSIMLAALESVSLVTVFEELNPISVMQRIQPDIYVKGGDYDISKLKEAPVVKSWGGTTRVLPFFKGYSTSDLIAHIQRA